MGGGGEADGEALLAAAEAEGESDVHLTDAARAEQDYILAARDVLAPGEFEDQHPVERRDGLEVQAVELFDDAKPSARPTLS